MPFPETILGAEDTAIKQTSLEMTQWTLSPVMTSFPDTRCECPAGSERP